MTFSAFKRLLPALLFACGCSAPDMPTAVGPSQGPEPEVSRVRSTQLSADLQTDIWLVDHDDWVYVDLERGLEVRNPSPQSSDEWDIAFRDTDVALNGGASGRGSVEAQTLELISYSGLETVIDQGWATDAPDGPDDDEEPEYLLSQGAPWFQVNESGDIEPRPRVYVIRTTRGRLFKLQFTRFHGPDGTPGHLRIRRAPVEIAQVYEPLIVDTSRNADWQYVSLVQGLVEPEDPASSEEWDLAVWGRSWRTNGGSSGPGDAGIRSVDMSRSELIWSDTIGFAVDQRSAAAERHQDGLAGSCLPLSELAAEGNGATGVFALRTARSEHARLQVRVLDEGIYEVWMEPIERRSVIRQRTVAFRGDDWVYLSLREDALIESPAPDDVNWDIALRGLQVRTNGGSSGQGLGAALEPPCPVLSALLDAPDPTFAVYVEDQILDSREGVGTFSGNPSLDSWAYEDPGTGTIHPRPASWVLRLADGTAARFQFRSHDEDGVTIAWSWAGPRHLRFF